MSRLLMWSKLAARCLAVCMVVAAVLPMALAIEAPRADAQLTCEQGELDVDRCVEVGAPPELQGGGCPAGASTAGDGSCFVETEPVTTSICFSPYGPSSSGTRCIFVPIEEGVCPATPTGEAAEWFGETCEYPAPIDYSCESGLEPTAWGTCQTQVSPLPSELACEFPFQLEADNRCIQVFDPPVQPGRLDVTWDFRCVGDRAQMKDFKVASSGGARISLVTLNGDTDLTILLPSNSSFNLVVLPENPSDVVSRVGPSTTRACGLEPTPVPTVAPTSVPTVQATAVPTRAVVVPATATPVVVRPTPSPPATAAPEPTAVATADPEPNSTPEPVAPPTSAPTAQPTPQPTQQADPVVAPSSDTTGPAFAGGIRASLGACDASGDRGLTVAIDNPQEIAVQWFVDGTPFQDPTTTGRRRGRVSGDGATHLIELTAVDSAVSLPDPKTIRFRECEQPAAISQLPINPLGSGLLVGAGALGLLRLVRGRSQQPAQQVPSQQVVAGLATRPPSRITVVRLVGQTEPPRIKRKRRWPWFRSDEGVMSSAEHEPGISTE